MPIDPWRTIGDADPSPLREAAGELHWAAQIVAAAGQAFADARPDDSHRALTWDPRLRALVGAPFAGPYPFRVILRPEDLVIGLVDREGEALGSLPLVGRTLADGLAWIGQGLASYSGSMPPPLELPDYEMPAHPLAEGGTFRDGREGQLTRLSTLFGASAAMLEQLTSTEESASPVTCWPHHFDIAALLTVEEDESGSATRTIGVGMAPFGGGYESWYWYVSPWPYPDAEALPPLEGPGQWHTEGWVGAVLRAEEVGASAPEFRDAVVRKFLDVGVRAARASLGG